jgi:hypothetical protein
LARDNVGDEPRVNFEVLGNGAYCLDGPNIFFALFPVAAIGGVEAQNCANMLVDDFYLVVVLDIEGFFAKMKQSCAMSIAILLKVFHAQVLTQEWCVCFDREQEMRTTELTRESRGWGAGLYLVASLKEKASKIYVFDAL